MRTRWKSAACAAVLACVIPVAEPAPGSGQLGLPAIPQPAGNLPSAAKIALGKRLFFDKGLSADHTISCASCHRPDHLFADRRARSEGVARRLGTRNAPSLLNAAFHTSQFWDGRRPDLEAQASDPLVHPSEHGLPDLDAVLRHLRQDTRYQRAFASSFALAPSDIGIRHVSAALAAFERTLVAGDSPFDRYFFKREAGALSPNAVRGLTLFRGRAQCAACHTIEANQALFTDQQFHSLSVGMKRIDRRLAELTTRLARRQERGESVDPLILNDEDIAELGRFAVTLEPADIGKFRTPSLRNVARTAPYMHDGSIATLEDAVEYEVYYRSATRGHPLALTPDEKRDLTAFLESLTSSAAALARLPSGPDGR